MIHGHGNDRYKYPQEIVADFSTSVYFRGLPPSLKRHLADNVGNIVNYPEPDAKKLRDRISEFYGLSNSQVVVTNGSTEAFYLLAHHYENQQSTIFIPSFAEYEDACKLYGHEIRVAANHGSIRGLTLNSNLVWIGNPNNPDGKVISPDDLKKFCLNNPELIIIVDEAYAELCTSFKSAVYLVDEISNLIVVRSLTKSFAIPGVRLGYMILSDDIYHSIAKFRIPWSVNSVAQEAGLFILDNYPDLIPDVNELYEQSLGFQRQINGINGVKVFKSHCNYFLVRLNKGQAKDLKSFLVKNYGLLIRDASNFRKLDQSYIRLAVQEEKFNQMLVQGMKEWISTI